MTKTLFYTVLRNLVVKQRYLATARWVPTRGLSKRGKTRKTVLFRVSDPSNRTPARENGLPFRAFQ